MSDDELCFAPALELAQAIRDKTLSSREVVARFLRRIESINPIVNAYITVCADQALEAADQADQAVRRGDILGSLHGVPVAIKDLLFTDGIRTTGGSLIYQDYIPDQDAVVVARLKTAGAIVLGKTNTPEFGFKSTTENSLLGATLNPWDLSKTAGGSSGGAGAATAAGIAPLSIGTDAGGSIRTPASFCGIFGFKPTFGRVPSGPGFGSGRTISHTGPMTRTVADAAALLDVIAGPHESDHRSIPAVGETYLRNVVKHPGAIRVGWSPTLGYAAVDPEVAAITQAAVASFSGLGWHVDQADPKFADPEDYFNTIIRAENFIATKDLVTEQADLLDPALRQFTENGASISALEYLQAQQRRDELCASLAQYFEHYDLLVTPSLAVAPLPLGTRPDEIAGKPVQGMSWLSFTYPFNLSGNPAASVPCGWTTNGLPIGLQIVGRRFADSLVLQASAAFEQVRPWAQRRPKLI